MHDLNVGSFIMGGCAVVFLWLLITNPTFLVFFVLGGLSALAIVYFLARFDRDSRFMTFLVPRETTKQTWVPSHPQVQLQPPQQSASQPVIGQPQPANVLIPGSPKKIFKEGKYNNELLKQATDHSNSFRGHKPSKSLTQWVQPQIQAPTQAQAQAQPVPLQTPSASVRKQEPKPSSGSEIRLEGYLELRFDTKMRKFFNKRYFVLREIGVLTYFHDEQKRSDQCYGHISLGGCEIQIRDSKQSSKFKFYIVHKKRKKIFHRTIPHTDVPAASHQFFRLLSFKCVLRTNSREQRQLWVDTLNAVRAKTVEETVSPADDNDENPDEMPVAVPDDESEAAPIEEEAENSSGSSSITEECLAPKDSVNLTNSSEISTLPLPSPPTQEPAESGEQQKGLMQILKSAVGLDITKISLPVTYFEPTTFLQRLCETSQYYRLLHIADQFENPIQQLTYVALFAISYNSCNTRIAKPFNPFLGETFEYIAEETDAAHFRFVAEQVSHHPPISAMIAESAHFVMLRNQGITTKLSVNSLDVSPTGNVQVTLKKSGNKFRWNYIRASVNNIIIGKTYVDQFGDMELLCTTTGDKALLSFTPCSLFGRGQYEVKGSVVDSKGKARIKLQGKWNSSVSLTDDGQLPWGDIDTKKPLWTHVENEGTPTGKFSLPPFAQKLNEIKDKKLLPPTDSRLRNDRLVLDTGDIDAAQKAKNEFENEQRQLRRQRETQGIHWQPKYFEKSLDEDGEEYYKFRSLYWKERSQRIAAVNSGQADPGDLLKQTRPH